MSGALTGRVALVTGASSGIGEAAALALAETGAQVAVSARRGDILDALVHKIEAAGGNAVALPGDIAEQDVAISIVEETVRRLGRIDILVNAAGIMPEGGVAYGDLKKWRAVMELNLMACLYTCHAAFQAMRPQGSGDIINITSTAGRRSNNMFGAYAVSKFGLTALTESLRQDAGPLGIRVCNIAPGAVNTALWQNIENEKLRGSVQQRAQGGTAMEPQDVADAVLFAVMLPRRATVCDLLLKPTSDVSP